LYAEAPEPEMVIGEYSDWIDLLTVHETAHLVHLLRPSRNPFERAMSHLLPLNPITLHAPRWVLEGYATVIEGRITGSGRPSGAMRAAVLRTWAMNGELPKYDQLNSDSRFLGGSAQFRQRVHRRVRRIAGTVVRALRRRIVGERDDAGARRRLAGRGAVAGDVARQR
jgi:hypothetical protein